MEKTSFQIYKFTILIKF